MADIKKCVLCSLWVDCTADILTNHSRESTGRHAHGNNSSVPLSASATVTVSYTGTLSIDWNAVIVAPPEFLTRQNACCATSTAAPVSAGCILRQRKTTGLGIQTAKKCSKCLIIKHDPLLNSTVASFPFSKC